jgi:hypothetical protein
LAIPHRSSLISQLSSDIRHRTSAVINEELNEPRDTNSLTLTQGRRAPSKAKQMTNIGLTSLGMINSKSKSKSKRKNKTRRRRRRRRILECQFEF